jgi:hypothetical protein
MPIISAPIAARMVEPRPYISRRQVKVFGFEIFLYEWVLTRKILCNNGLSKVKIIYFSKPPPFSVC